MADFIVFDEGANLLLTSGLPATCRFDLSSKSVGATNAFTAADTFASRGVITGTGYAEKTQARPTAAARAAAFSLMSWVNGSATDWPANVRSVVLHDGSKAICAWNLIAGGVARDMSQANTTENVTPTLTL